MIVIQRYARGWLARRKMNRLSTPSRYVCTYVRTPIVLRSERVAAKKKIIYSVILK